MEVGNNYARRKGMTPEDRTRLLHEAYQFLIRKFNLGDMPFIEVNEYGAPVENIQDISDEPTVLCDQTKISNNIMKFKNNLRASAKETTEEERLAAKAAAEAAAERKAEVQAQIEATRKRVAFLETGYAKFS